MKTKWITGAAVLLAVAGCGGENVEQDKQGTRQASAAGSAEMRPGQWEVTSQVVKMEMPGMPPGVEAMTREKTTSKTCITAEDLAKAESGFLPEDQRKNCRSDGFKMAGGKVNGTVTCTGGEQPGTVKMALNGTYTADTYDITMAMDAEGGPEGGGMSMESRVTAERIGECPASDSG